MAKIKVTPNKNYGNMWVVYGKNITLLKLPI